MALNQPRGYLADKSALARLRHPTVAAVLEPLILADMVVTCGVVDLEVLYSTTGATDFSATRRHRALAFPRAAVTDTDFVRAVDVMGLLAEAGRHRSAGG